MNPKLKFIDIQNFQGYKRARIPLTDFTLMVGLSSSGKTSVFRASEFLLYGEWDDTYSHDPTKATAVAFEFENGTRILRIRTKDGLNQAAIIRNGETVKFKSFGAIIPGLKSLINAGPITMGNNEVNLNFSFQDDGPFMVSASKPVRAQWIGRLYGAHIISQMIRDMVKDKKNADAKRKEAEERLERVTQELGTYSTIEEQEALLAEAEALLGTYNAIKACEQEASILKVNTDSFNRDKWVLQVDTKDLKADMERYAALLLVKQEFDVFVKNKKDYDNNSKFSSIDAKQLKKEIETLTELINVRDFAKETIKNKKVDMLATKVTKDAIKSLKASLSKELLSNGMCPVCNGLMEGDTGHVLNNIARLIGSQP